MINDKLKIIPLGGVGEIGKNMTVIEYGNDIIVVDCGLIFPDEDMLGIDLVIPDMTYIEENIDRLRAFLITHGHEDHIGALPYALKTCNVPVYGTDLTLALIQHKINETDGLDDVELVKVDPGDIIDLGCFSVEFIKSNHSIAGAVALAITTPLGVIIHTGDFKVDFTPIDGEPLDISRLCDYGSCGVLALMSDSTNSELPGYTPSEQEIGKTFEHYFDMSPGRVIVASFASNIYRIQQIADVAISNGRIICFQGRSMINISQIARRLGYLNIPDECIVDLEQLENYPDERICVITTGSQGEPMSGLFRMANSSHKLNVGKGDTVIISASAIPGNEVGVSRVINQFYQKGAQVIYDPMADVHVSGHACRGELSLMLAITKPEYFIPIHGQYRHLYQHANIAESMGVDEDNIFVLDIGDVLEIDESGANVASSVPCGSVLIDGLGIGDVGNSVLRDRRLLSRDGLIVAAFAISKQTGKLLSEPEIITKGFVYAPESEELLNSAAELVGTQAENFSEYPYSEWSTIKNNIRSSLKSFLHNKTKRTPVILISISYVDTEPNSFDMPLDELYEEE